MNKKIILIFAAILGAITANAQTQKGDQLLGGDLAFGTGTQTTNYVNPGGNSGSDKSTCFSIGPTYGYFIANNLDLSVNLAYGTQHDSYNSIATPVAPDIANTFSNFKSYSAAIFLRRYFLYNNKFGIRTGPFFNYQDTKSRYDFTDASYNYSQSGHNYNAGVGLDLVYFPSKSMGFAAKIGTAYYQHDDQKQTPNDTDIKSNSFQLALVGDGLSLSAFYCF